MHENYLGNLGKLLNTASPTTAPSELMNIWLQISVSMVSSDLLLEAPICRPVYWHFIYQFYTLKQLTLFFLILMKGKYYPHSLNLHLTLIYINEYIDVQRDGRIRQRWLIP